MKMKMSAAAVATSSLLLLAVTSLDTAAASSSPPAKRDPAHPVCREMQSYQSDYVAKEYDINRHVGHYYEVGFRDLYLPPPRCDCQHTYKVLDDADKQNYHENFEFKCSGAKVGLGRMTSVLGMNSQSPSVPAVFNQSFVWSHPEPPVPGLEDIMFQTATIAFKTVPEQQQYEWVVEFTCGTEPVEAFQHLFPGGFVGLNMYSREGPLMAQNLAEMKAAVSGLGLDWVMEDWGWGFHEVPHAKDCQYSSEEDLKQEYVCEDGQCKAVQWGLGTNLTACSDTCK